MNIQEIHVPEISWIIPAYNEEQRLPKTLKSLMMELEGLNYEIITIDDCSNDRTLEVVEEYVENFGLIVTMRSHHGGRGGALKRGIQKARGRTVILSSADIIIRRKDLDRYLKLAEKFDIIMLSKHLPRSKVSNRSLSRKTLSIIFSNLVRLLFKLPFKDTQGVKIGKRSVFERLLRYSSFDDFLFDTEIVVDAYRSGFKLFEAPWFLVDKGGSKVRLRDALFMLVGLIRMRTHLR